MKKKKTKTEQINDEKTHNLIKKKKHAKKFSKKQR